MSKRTYEVSESRSRSNSSWWYCVVGLLLVIIILLLTLIGFLWKAPTLVKRESFFNATETGSFASNIYSSNKYTNDIVGKSTQIKDTTTRFSKSYYTKPEIFSAQNDTTATTSIEKQSSFATHAATIASRDFNTESSSTNDKVPIANSELTSHEYDLDKRAEDTKPPHIESDSKTTYSGVSLDINTKTTLADLETTNQEAISSDADDILEEFNTSTFGFEEVTTLLSKVHMLNERSMFSADPDKTTEGSPKKEECKCIFEDSESTTNPTTRQTFGTHGAIQRSTVSTVTEKACTSYDCMTSATNILASINFTTDPCEDFYEFACGGRKNRVENGDEDFESMKRLIDEDQGNNEAVNIYNKFFRSCVNHRRAFDYQGRINSVNAILKEIGSFQDRSAPSSNKVDVTALISQLLLRGSMPFFDLGMDVESSTNKYIIQLTPPGQTSVPTGYEGWSSLSQDKEACLAGQRSKIYGQMLDLTEIYEGYSKCLAKHELYLSNIVNVLEAIGAFSNLSKSDRNKSLKETVDGVQDLLKIIEEMPSTSVIKMGLANREFKTLTVKEISTQFHFLDWKKLLDIITGKILSDGTRLRVYFYDSFVAMFKKLSQIKPGLLFNSLLAMYAKDLHHNIIAPNQEEQREKHCWRLGTFLLPDVTSQIYTILTPNMKDQAAHTKKLFDTMKEAFEKSVQGAEWLNNDPSVDEIVNKARSIELHFQNSTMGKLQSIDLNETDFGLNLVRAMSRKKRLIYGLEGTSYEADNTFRLFLSPFSRKPEMIYESNLIAIPYGFLRRISKENPNELLVAGPMWQVAREFGRHFDPVGIKLRASLSSDAELLYENSLVMPTKDVLVDIGPRRNYKGQTLSFVVDGALSLNSRIAENTALRLVMDTIDAIKPAESKVLPLIDKIYSKDKIMFLTLAQEFCGSTDIMDHILELFETEYLPAVLSVENIILNSDSFPNVFQCREGAAMNILPENMKRQFPYIPRDY